jgi:hypothetical protein
MMSERAPSSRPAQYSVSVTDGRDAVGTVKLIDGSHVAIDITGKVVGTFATLKAALASSGGPQ